MSVARRFLGVRMDAQRADALRIVAARHRISVSELMCRAAEAQYGDEMDAEQARPSAPDVLHRRNKRSAQVVERERAS